jgi:Tfp pilus assembly protein PilF
MAESGVSTQIQNLESMLERGQDNALLRFALGSAFLKYGKYAEAAIHLAKAVEFDPGYSAAWKLYGKALQHQDKLAEAGDVYQKGIKAAENKGDIQAAKEMKVFLKRLKQQ